MEDEVTRSRKDLLAINAVTEFQLAPQPPAIRRWVAPIPAGLAIVEVNPSPRSTFTARLRIDRQAGAGPRTVGERSRRSTSALALQDARALLHGVVEGRMP